MTCIHDAHGLFERGGFVLWYKRLERGSFKPLPTSADGPVQLDATQLAMLLDGIDIRRVRAPKHWTPRREGIDIALAT